MLICPCALLSKAESTREKWKGREGAVVEQPAFPWVGLGGCRKLLGDKQELHLGQLALPARGW